MLDDLLMVKRRREDDAVAAVGEAKRALEHQQSLHDAKRCELQDFKAWRKEEAERLFDKVKRQPVSRATLERYRQDAALLQQRQLQLQEELSAAEREVKAAEANLDRAKERRALAHKEVVKFEEYQQLQLEEEAVESARREESELEDVVASRKA